MSRTVYSRREPPRTYTRLKTGAIGPLVGWPTATGSGEFVIHPFEIDHDRDLILNFANLQPGETLDIPVGFSHVPTELEPISANIGVATVRLDPNDRTAMRGVFQLDMDNVMARAVHERAGRPPTDPQRLDELSIEFSFDPADAWIDPNGVRMIKDAWLTKIAIVHQGAQRTQILNVKIGARNSQVDQAALDEAHSAIVRAGAACPGVAPEPKSLRSIPWTRQPQLRTTTGRRIPEPSPILTGPPMLAELRQRIDEAEQATPTQAEPSPGLLALLADVHAEVVAERRMAERVRGISLLPDQLIPSLAEDAVADQAEHLRFESERRERDRRRAEEWRHEQEADESRRRNAAADPNILTP